MRVEGAAGQQQQPADDEVWRVGTAAEYLNDGGIDFHVRPRDVQRMADDPGSGIVKVSGGGGRHRRVLASSVRAVRARMLASAGRSDPAGTVPPPA